MVGCATEPKPILVNKDEVLRKDRNLWEEVSRNFEPHLKLKKDTEVSVYLRKVAQILVDANAEMKGSPVGVWLIQSKDEKWLSFNLPKNRIYLPVEFLKELRFENEIAGLIAIQLGHLLKGQTQLHIKSSPEFRRWEDAELEKLTGNGMPSKNPQLDYFGPSGVFAYSETELAIALQTAVGILYKAGYDPRGLISLCEKLINNSAHSPYEVSTIEKLMEQTRSEISAYAPLRNPIVRSQSFLNVQKRLERL
jgi:predicted Zn-dependent protease